jgi:hypothetical protein
MTYESPLNIRPCNQNLPESFGQYLDLPHDMETVHGAVAGLNHHWYLTTAVTRKDPIEGGEEQESVKEVHRLGLSAPSNIFVSCKGDPPGNMRL